MLKLDFKTVVTKSSLTAFALFAVVACAGKSAPAPSAVPSTFVPTQVSVDAKSKENFSTASGGIITVEARTYKFKDATTDVVLRIAGSSPVGQDVTTMVVKNVENKYVATDFCADFKAEDPKACSYIAVVLNRSSVNKNETRSILFKNSPNGLELVCARDQAYPDSEQTYIALRKECDPEQTPAPAPTASPAPTATPVAEGESSASPL